MSSVNKVILIGNVGRDPEVRYDPSGKAIANVSLATTRSWKNKDGERQEATDWHRLMMFDRIGEIAGQYVRKGSQIYIEGRIRYGEYTDKEGVKRYTTEIVVSSLQLLGSSQRNASGQGEQARGEQGNGAPASPGKDSSGGNAPPAGGFDDMDDDIPF